MTEIGKGSRRVCFRLPDALLCVKRYRDDGEVGETVRKEIERCKFDRKSNTCAQEYDYIRSLEKILSPETFAVFPEKMELKEDPVYGWHLVESLVLNGDGSVPERFSRTCRAADANMRRRLLAAFRNLAHAFEVAAVRFYDPQNVLVQWSGKPFEGDFRLRIVDFEPASRAFLPIDLVCPALRRMKVCGPVAIVLFTGLLVFATLSCVLSLPVIEKLSAEYAHQQHYDLEASSGYTHASLYFYLLMGMPFICTLWWAWSLAILHKAEKKGLLAAVNGDDGEAK